MRGSTVHSDGAPPVSLSQLRSIWKTLSQASDELGRGDRRRQFESFRRALVHYNAAYDLARAVLVGIEVHDLKDCSLRGHEQALWLAQQAEARIEDTYAAIRALNVKDAPHG